MPRARRRDGRHARRAARRHAAHPSGAGHRHSSDAALAGSLSLEQSRYEGPTGIVGIVQDACTAAGVPALSIWAAVPHYVAQPPCPKATLALLRHIEDLLDVPLPLGDLPEDARAWERGVDELAAEDPEVADYVRSLEEAQDPAELPEASGDAIAREFERYLRRRAGDDPPRPAVEGGRGGAQVVMSRRASARSRIAAGASAWVPTPGWRSRRPSRRSTTGRSQRRRGRGPAPRGHRRRPAAHAGPACADAAARQQGHSRSSATVSSSAVPLPVRPVVVREQRQPDGHRVRAGLTQTVARTRGCPWTSTSSPSSPTIPAWT